MRLFIGIQQAGQIPWAQILSRDRLIAGKSLHRQQKIGYNPKYFCLLLQAPTTIDQFASVKASSFNLVPITHHDLLTKEFICDPHPPPQPWAKYSALGTHLRWTDVTWDEWLHFLLNYVPLDGFCIWLRIVIAFYNWLMLTLILLQNIKDAGSYWVTGQRSIRKMSKWRGAEPCSLF